MLKLIFSDSKGRIFVHPGLEATGMKAGMPFSLSEGEFVKLPPASRLFMLPDRNPVGYDALKSAFVSLDDSFAVAAFISPGFTTTYSASYKETGRPKPLPLFSYSAVAARNGELYATAVRVDKDTRHDSSFIDMNAVRKNIKKLRKTLANNRIARHLENCATRYGCVGAQNFFLGKHECPLPTSPYCNARCIGCISYKYTNACAGTQPRIKFIPTPQEVSEIALFHMNNVPDAVVSFGQGCEGEPLLNGGLIEESIRLIRNKISKGTININTNASSPDAISRLFDAGLDSIRVSLNSARAVYYHRYYKPLRYTFKDVMRSIGIAKSKNGFVSINYLTMPGFTDRLDEYLAMKRLIKDYDIDMVQWRNLNFDPVLYFKKLKIENGGVRLLGIRQVINSLKQEHPKLLTGYFNPRVTASRHPRRRAV